MVRTTVISRYIFGEAYCKAGLLDARLHRSTKARIGVLTTSVSGSTAYRRRYPQTGKAVGHARRDVVEFAKACGFAGQTLADIEVAVGEGLANAVEHAREGEIGINVWVRRNADALIVEIKDSGGGFDHGSVCRRTRPPSEALRGFGTFIMRELMDEIHYSEFGTRLRLLKRLPLVAMIKSSSASA